MSDERLERPAPPPSPTSWRNARRAWSFSARLTTRHVDWFLRLRSGRALPASFRARFLAMRIPPETIDRALADVHRLDDWLPAWHRAAQRFLSEARRDEANGGWLTAAVARRNAAMCYHVAHLITDDDPRTVRALRAAGVQAFAQAVPRLFPNTKKVGIRWRTSLLPAYLAKPIDAAEPAPIAVLLNGATTIKEELLLWADAFLARGLAVIALDWPGTGETADGGQLTSHVDDVTDGLLAFAEQDEELNADRMALVGFSLGGAVALRAAALDRRIDACVAVTPPYDAARWIGAANPIVRQQLLSLAGKAASLDELAADFALPDVMSRLRCPLLVFGAGRDLVVPPDEALHLAAAAGDLGTLVWYPRAAHGLYEVVDDWTAVAADWLGDYFGLPVPSRASTRVDNESHLAVTPTAPTPDEAPAATADRV